MGKNILIITGSPRKGSNTDQIAESFARGAKECGHSVELFNASMHTIKPCVACDCCWKSGNPCITEDDFNKVLAGKLESADLLALVTPMYWFTYSSQLKLAMEKMYSYLSENKLRELKIKESVLLFCCGDKDISVATGLMASYRCMIEYLNIKNKGVIGAIGVNDRDSIRNTEYLHQAYQLALQL